ncbi:MAG: hypothetical protein H6728_01465 [Myxococcales bacterium]|nr:hypothetical protein [Myxococcales bacterium]MCB9641721.1 hypothetical protein [Myxococcales bacterium]
MFSNASKNALFFLSFLSLLLFAPGCPNTTNQEGNTQNDGGTTEKTVQPLNCEKGTACFVVGNQDVRACDILLKNSAAVQNPRVEFDVEAIGQFKHRDTRLALSFIQQKDNGFAAGKYAALVRMDGDLAGLEISQATCYDRKGAKIDAPDVRMERP